jgi:RNA polymerase sigma-70 factor (ECF subfamily)
LNEEQLIQGLIERNEHAFRHLVELYKDKVFNTCLSFTHNREDAEEAAQDVFISVYHSISAFQRKSSLSTWIYRITVNKSLEHIRKRKRKSQLGFINMFLGRKEESPGMSGELFDHPGVQLENLERTKILYGAINGLPENQRVAFTLYEFEGLSYKDISGVMEVSVAAVESLIFRAKKKLREKLHKHYNDHEI